MRVSVVDFSGSKVYYPYVASIVGKKHGNQTYYYLVTSARVDGKPRIVQQQYLGTSEEVTARLSGDQAGMPERVQHKGFGIANRVVAPCSKLAFADWWVTTAGPRFTKVGAPACDHRNFWDAMDALDEATPVSYTHLRAHETKANLVCRLLLEKKKKK